MLKRTLRLAIMGLPCLFGLFSVKAADLQGRHGLLQDPVAVVRDSCKDGGTPREGGGLTPWLGTPLKCCSASSSQIHLGMQVSGMARDMLQGITCAASTNHSCVKKSLLCNMSYGSLLTEANTL